MQASIDRAVKVGLVDHFRHNNISYEYDDWLHILTVTDRTNGDKYTVCCVAKKVCNTTDTTEDAASYGTTLRCLNSAVRAGRACQYFREALEVSMELFFRESGMARTAANWSLYRAMLSEEFSDKSGYVKL